MHAVCTFIHFKYQVSFSICPVCMSGPPGKVGLLLTCYVEPLQIPMHSANKDAQMDVWK